MDFMDFIARLFRWQQRRFRAWSHASFERTELLSPEQFVRLYRTDRDTIKSAEVAPPQVGDPDFGRIVIVRQFKPELEFVER